MSKFRVTWVDSAVFAAFWAIARPAFAPRRSRQTETVMAVHRHSRQLALAAGVVVTGLACAALAWATLLTPELVVNAKGRQFDASASAGVANIAYAQSRPGHPGQFDVYVKPAGQPRYKVNARGEAFAGGIDGNTLIYQSIRNGQSDLRLFDLATHTRSVPAGVNTRRAEYAPTISGSWILFGRLWHSHPLNSQVILHNTTTSETRVIAERINRRGRDVAPGQLNGDFATWQSDNARTGGANVFLYQISTSASTKVPEPTGKVQYFPAVVPSGAVFYVRCNTNCEAHVVLREYASGVDTPLAVMPRGYDIFRTFAVDEGSGVTSVYFSRYQCSTGRSHIYKITVG